jgi:hypothetical protein
MGGYAGIESRLASVFLLLWGEADVMIGMIARLLSGFTSTEADARRRSGRAAACILTE